MKQASKIIAFPRHQVERGSDEIAFLPAALEVVETPPSPLGRAIAFAIMAMFAVALIWACLAHVDIIASAKGQIVPSGRTKLIQPFETGVVRAIHVHDGQIVKAGEPLIELDPTIDDAELKHYQSDLVAAQLDIARLQAELGDGDPLEKFHPPVDAPPSLVSVQRQFLIDQVSEQKDKIAVFDRQQVEKQAEEDTVKATIDKLQASLPILQQRVEIRKTLYEHTTGSLANYLEILQPYVEQQHELQVQKRHLSEAVAAIATIQEQRQEARAEFRRERYADLAEAERKAGGLREDVVRAGHRAALEVLRAPVDGKVQQLNIHTVGGVVTPAQSLLVVVPTEAPLEIEAMIQNRDVGFVHAGQKAEIKVDAFDFNRYGLVDGTVESVSPDAITNDHQTDATDRKSTSSDKSTDPTPQNPSFAARVLMAHSQMKIDGNLVNLTPGMSVTVEVKTGSRRVISYLLSPLLTYSHDALRER